MRPSSRLPRELSERPEHCILVTPNRRLAAALKAEFDAARIAEGKQAWIAPTILPIGVYLEQLFRSSATTSDPQSRLQLIDASQSQLLWEHVIRKASGDTVLLSVAAAARQAGGAWQLMHDWRLQNAMRSAQLHEDGVVFMRWAARYQQILRERKLIDSALLSDVLIESLGRRDRAAGPAELVRPLLFTAGFDIVPPQLERLFGAFVDAGTEVRAVPAMVSVAGAAPERAEFTNERDELFACAGWARRLLQEDSTQTIGVVVPALRSKRALVQRVFMETFAPGIRAGISGVSDHQENPDAVFNISLGEPLIDFPLVHDAVGLIELTSGREISYLEVSNLMRSPFVGGARREFSARADLDAKLREQAPDMIDIGWLNRRLQAATVGRLQTAVGAAGLLSGMIMRAGGNMSQTRLSASAASPVEWARRFSEWLSHWGFPGDVALDSASYQVLSKFQDALSQLAAFQLVEPRMRLDEAIAGLRRVVADTVFQPEAEVRRPPAIQVLGVLESAGQAFDALWVTGLSEAEWPLVTRPNPFIPAALQRRAGVPEASAEASLNLDRTITQGWENAARVVVFSHALRTSDMSEAPRQASPLIAHIPRSAADAPIARAYAVELQMANRALQMETVADSALPPLPTPTEVSGGATLIRDQAACPFRAMARHRLGARPLDVPGGGFDAAERGVLLHRVLSLTWTQIRSLNALTSLSSEACSEIVDAAAGRAIAESHAKGAESLSGRFAEIERARLTRLVASWLNLERERGPFDVESCEEKKTVSVGALKMSLRLDRVDRLADGTRVLIDYKSGLANARNWLGERPDDPQLPLYWRTSDTQVSALAFARLKRGKTFGFDGFSAAESDIPNVGPVESRRGMAEAGLASWRDLERQWTQSIDALADQFQHGIAAVDPKHGGQTCQQCDLQTVCRVAEYLGNGESADERGSDPAEDAGVVND